MADAENGVFKQIRSYPDLFPNPTSTPEPFIPEPSTDVVQPIKTSPGEHGSDLDRASADLFWVQQDEATQSEPPWEPQLSHIQTYLPATEEIPVDSIPVFLSPGPTRPFDFEKGEFTDHAQEVFRGNIERIIDTRFYGGYIGGKKVAGELERAHRRYMRAAGRIEEVYNNSLVALRSSPQR